nr:hypothetical protein [Amycolatopsis vastitatis]
MDMYGVGCGTVKYSPAASARTTGANGRERAEGFPEFDGVIQPRHDVGKQRGREDRAIPQGTRARFEPAVEETGDPAVGQLTGQEPGRRLRLVRSQAGPGAGRQHQPWVGGPEIAAFGHPGRECSGRSQVGGDGGAECGAGVAGGRRDVDLVEQTCVDDLADGDTVGRDTAA